MRYYFLFTAFLIFSSPILAKEPYLGTTFAHRLYYSTLKKSYKDAIQTFKNANKAAEESEATGKEGSEETSEKREEAIEGRLGLIHQGEQIIQDMGHRPGDIDDQTLKGYHEIYQREFQPIVGQLAKYKPKPLPKSSAFAKALPLKPTTPPSPPATTAAPPTPAQIPPPPASPEPVAEQLPKK